MPAQAICCGECSLPIPAESWNRAGTRCRGCGQNIEVAVFPAVESTRVGSLPESIEGETEASCFYHPTSRAAVHCDECGRFLCHLCEIQIDGRHICPRCFETGVSSSKIQSMETSRTMYDSIALSLATIPALLIWPVLVGAPAAFYVVIRRWRAPGSIVPRTRVRFILAALFALAELAGIALIIYAIVRQGVLSSPRVAPQ
jgi:hypothetical protein